MLIVINYGEKKLNLKLPDNISFDVYNQKPSYSIVDFMAFKEILLSSEKNLFELDNADFYVINDAYRPTPSYLILEWISKLGKLNDRAKFLIATGCHQPPDENQLKKIFGNLYARLKDRIFVHDACDKDKLINIGQDSFRQPVLISRYFHDADRVVIIGSVEPHYFAGFTGGRKSIFPGLCDYDTTARNHNLATSFEAMPMKLEDNPVEEHLQSLMHLLPNKDIYTIQLVLSGDNDIAGIFCGELKKSFEKACEPAVELFGVHTEGGHDLLLAEVRPPLDGNLYQLQKSLENCQTAVRDGGTVLLFSPCYEGVGERSFYDLAESWTPEGKVTLNNRAMFGQHKLSRVYHIGQRINIRLYSELNPDVGERVFYKAESNPQKTIDNLINKRNCIKVGLVHDAGHTVLVN